MALALVTETPEQATARTAGGDGPPPDATHYDIAQDFLADLARKTGCDAVFTLGAQWRYDPGGLWQALSLDAVAAHIGARYRAHKLCRRGSDYKQVAQIVASLSEDDTFFVDAPNGIAAGGQFWRVADDGQILAEALRAEHRQRLMIDVVPDADAPMPLFERLLADAFGAGAAGQAQTELLQMALGAALTRRLWRCRTVLLLYGPTAAGKSTVLEVLRSFIHPDGCGGTPPHNWASEYFVASLAGKALNLVGELDPETPIPPGVFKAVTGGDLIDGRYLKKDEAPQIAIPATAPESIPVALPGAGGSVSVAIDWASGITQIVQLTGGGAGAARNLTINHSWPGDGTYYLMFQGGNNNTSINVIFAGTANQRRYLSSIAPVVALNTSWRNMFSIRVIEGVPFITYGRFGS